MTAEGPHWVVKVPVTGDERAFAALPAGVEVQTVPGREELSVVLPGRSSTPKYASALSRLLRYPAEHDLGARMADPASARQVLHEDSVETAVELVVSGPGVE